MFRQSQLNEQCAFAIGTAVFIGVVRNCIRNEIYCSLRFLLFLKTLRFMAQDETRSSTVAGSMVGVFVGGSFIATWSVQVQVSFDTTTKCCEEIKSFRTYDKLNFDDRRSLFRSYDKAKPNQ